ncbi:MAG: cyclase [Gemmatimonadetes bacterium]|nr:cyclase [Gemmatimonadota bacterium]
MIYDISVPVRHGGVVYPGNPTISITAQQAISQGAGANVSRLDLGSHTGTHVDAPKHFFDDGAGVDGLSLDVLMGPARLLAFSDDVKSIGEAELRAHDLTGVTRVLLKTRNSAWLASGSSEFHPDYTYLAPDGAEYLVSLGVKLVGVDYLSVEQFHSGHHKTHRTLLERAIIIVEGLMMNDVPPGNYELCCLPILFPGLDGAPARAVLVST